MTETELRGILEEKRVIRIGKDRYPKSTYKLVQDE